MLDTTHALEDMANQIRACRSADGLTLQQLATRSGVAASTIHKVEARQMVPTVAVLLKIAKGLGCRPEELIRDHFEGDETPEIEAQAPSDVGSGNGALLGGPPTLPPQDTRPTPARGRPDFGVWKLDLSRERTQPTLDLAPEQRAIVLVEDGEVDLRTSDRRVRMDAGDCIEIEGGRIESGTDHGSAARVTLIVSPPGDLAAHQGHRFS